VRLAHRIEGKLQSGIRRRLHVVVGSVSVVGVRGSVWSRGGGGSGARVQQLGKLVHSEHEEEESSLRTPEMTERREQGTIFEHIPVRICFSAAAFHA
jgi:hypothetical protein